MDRIGPRARRLILAALLVTAVSSGAVEPRRLLKAERWLSDSGRLRTLSTRPRECLTPPATRESAALIAIGRTAFRAPTLLGGQAAKAGMSCASCHANGRVTRDFRFPGLSGPPGTADVTSSLMSSHRGDGVFDPRPIPDLAFPAKIARDPDEPALPSFVHGLVAEEFDGADPGPLTMRGLLAYLRAIRPCAPDDTEPVTLGAALADVAAAVAAAGSALRLRDAGTARLMLGGARATLGDIDERYAGIGEAQRGLRHADRTLSGLQQAIDREEPGTVARIERWRPPKGLVRALRQAERRSLYDGDRLARSLTRR